MSTLIVLPIAIPMVTGILTLLLRFSVRAMRVVSILGALALLGTTGAILAHVMEHGIYAAQMGGWVAPVGITLVADHLSAAILVSAAFVAVCVAVYALAGIDLERERFGFHTLFHLLLMGVNGAFITGDVFNLYVWFEVLLIASFVLLVLGNERKQLDGAMKYVGINLISSVSFLAAIGLLYGLTGTLNMADAAGRMVEVRGTGIEAALAMLFLIGFGIKAALFPLYFWAPAAYHTAPAPVAAIFAGLLTKVGIYALMRIFTLLFPEPTGYTQGVLLVVAGGTMLVGAFGALVERDVQRMLAFLLVSAMGYMVMGLGFFTTLGLVGVVFYILQDIPVKAALFLMGGLMERETQTVEVAKMGGLYTERPVIALAFLVPAFSLAGFPPFPGFWAKLTLVQAGLQGGQGLIVAVALLASAVTLLVVAQVWARAFWGPVPERGLAPRGRPLRRLLVQAPVVVLAVALLAVGLYAQPLYDVAAAAADTLANPQPYIDAVLGPASPTASAR